jgi:multidrug resistance protein, MATE family
MVIPLKDKYLEIRHLLKESWAMGWPMILIMSFQFAIGLTDVYVAGYFGKDVVAAVGYVTLLYWALMIMANGLSMGTVSMVSQAYGAKSSEGIGCIAANSMLLGLCISGVLTIIAQLFPATIVRIAGMPQEIQTIAESFVRVFSLVLIPTYLMIITGGVLRSSGRIHIATINSVVAATSNLVGELVLSFGWGPVPALGFIGIAWGTAIATTLGMVLNLYHIVSGPARITLWSLTNPLSGCIRNLIKLGVPTALQQTAWNGGTLVVYFLVGRLQGGETTALAAMTYGVRVEAIIFLPIFALNMASAVLTGNRLGAGDVAGARSGAKVTALLCLAIIFLPATAIFILAPQISALLTQDPAVMQEMIRYLRVNMIGEPFMAIGLTLSGALQGAGDTFATMRIIFTGMWLLRIPFILAVIYILGTSALGIWWSMTVSIVIMCGLLAYRFKGNAWIKASVDKTTNTMLWEACLPGGERSGREDSVTEKIDSGL